MSALDAPSRTPSVSVLTRSTPRRRRRGGSRSPTIGSLIGPCRRAARARRQAAARGHLARGDAVAVEHREPHDRRLLGAEAVAAQLERAVRPSPGPGVRSIVSERIASRYSPTTVAASPAARTPPACSQTARSHSSATWSRSCEANTTAVAVLAQLAHALHALAPGSAGRRPRSPRRAAARPARAARRRRTRAAASCPRCRCASARRRSPRARRTRAPRRAARWPRARRQPVTTSAVRAFSRPVSVGRTRRRGSGPTRSRRAARRAARRPAEAGREPQQRRLARAVGADQPDALARPRRERHVAQRPAPLLAARATAAAPRGDDPRSVRVPAASADRTSRRPRGRRWRRSQLVHEAGLERAGTASQADARRAPALTDRDRGEPRGRRGSASRSARAR